MTDNSLTPPPPRAPHPASMNDPALTLNLPASGLSLTYCPRHRTAAMFSTVTWRWSIQGPIDPAAVVAGLEFYGLPFEWPAIEAWLDRIRQVESDLGSINGD